MRFVTFVSIALGVSNRGDQLKPLLKRKSWDWNMVVKQKDKLTTARLPSENVALRFGSNLFQSHYACKLHSIYILELHWNINGLEITL